MVALLAGREGGGVERTALFIAAESASRPDTPKSFIAFSSAANVGNGAVEPHKPRRPR